MNFWLLKYIYFLYTQLYLRIYSIYIYILLSFMTFITAIIAFRIVKQLQMISTIIYLFLIIRISLCIYSFFVPCWRHNTLLIESAFLPVLWSSLIECTMNSFIQERLGNNRSRKSLDSAQKRQIVSHLIPWLENTDIWCVTIVFSAGVTTRILDPLGDRTVSNRACKRATLLYHVLQ